MTGIIVVEIVPSSNQTCTSVIDRLSTVPLIVNGSPRTTFREDLPAGVEAGSYAFVRGATIVGTGEDAFIAGIPVVPIGIDVAFTVPWGDIHPEDVTRTTTSSGMRDRDVDHVMPFHQYQEC
jgi:hypothetical protein